MKLSTKILLLIAAVLVMVGGLSFVVVMSVNHWDFTKISTAKYNTARHEITDTFHSISVNTNTADITILPAEDGVARAVCFEKEKLTHAVAVKDGVLTVTVEDSRRWYDHIQLFDFQSPKITVYLPESTYAALTLKADTGDTEIARGLQFDSISISTDTGDVTCYASATDSIRINTDTGDIMLGSVSAGAVTLSTDTGDIEARNLDVTGAVEITVDTGDTELVNVNCLTLTSTGHTGDIELEGVLAEGLLSVKRSTGDVSLSVSDARELIIETDTGDVKGTLLTAKVFLAHASTGRVNVPETSTGGTCKINTDTGDIRITLVGG